MNIIPRTHRIVKALCALRLAPPPESAQPPNLDPRGRFPNELSHTRLVLALALQLKGLSR